MSATTKILLVDDDEDFLFQHRIQLENAGFEVATATTRAAAEEALTAFAPDLAILDLMMGSGRTTGSCSRTISSGPGPACP